jgi:hypothetical protein
LFGFLASTLVLNFLLHCKNGYLYVCATMFAQLFDLWKGLDPLFQSVLVVISGGLICVVLRSVVLRKFSALAPAINNDRLVQLRCVWNMSKIGCMHMGQIPANPEAFDGAR